MTPSSVDTRGNNFDILRFALAISVIYSHSFPITSSGVDAADPLAHFSEGRTSIGALAVDGFFVISGFLITQSWLRSSSLASFLKRRLLRIGPGYAVAIFACHFVVAPLACVSLGEIFSGPQTLDFLTRLIPLRAYNELTSFPNNARPFMMNESLWTIRFELACYLMVPVLGFLQCYRNPRRLLLLFVALLGCRLALAAFAPPSTPDMALHWVIIKAMARFTTCFVAGSLLLAHGEKLPRSPWAVAAAALILCAVCRSNFAFPVLGPLCTAFLVMRLALARSIRFPNFARHGDFSYGIYLYAYPIQQLIAQCCPGLTANELFLLSVGPSFAVGVASWYGIERRFLPRSQIASQAVANEQLQPAAMPLLRIDAPVSAPVAAPKRRHVAVRVGRDESANFSLAQSKIHPAAGKESRRPTRRAMFQARLLQTARRKADAGFDRAENPQLRGRS